MRQLDLQNGDNWEDLYSSSHSITQTGPRSYIPIGEIQIPVLFEKPILAFYCESPSAPAHWVQAGWLNQKVRVGFTVGGAADGNRQNGRLMLLKKIMLVEWESLGGSYQVSFTPKKYLDDITLRIWQYTGPIVDSLEEQVDLTRIDLLRIEKQLQFVAQRDVVTTYEVE
jgi:hypothetical protein